MTEETTALLRRMYRDYTRSEAMNLDCDACYHSGATLRPVVPLDCGIGSVFILGAYPSARFMTVDDITDVPSADNLGPFETERWFDGQRVREQRSAAELHECLFGPLRLNRAECWVTDLVKVFLFKRGHIRKYDAIPARAPSGYGRERFFELGRASLPWIRQELDIARPRLVITLGAEVAGVIHGVAGASRQVALLQPRVAMVCIAGLEVATIHCAHPGILMRKSASNPWPKKNETEYLPEIQRFLNSGTLRT